MSPELRGIPGMEELVVGMISLTLGCLMVFFRKPFAGRIIREQNRFWGFHFGESELRLSMVISAVVGIGFIVFALLLLFQIIRFK